MNNQSCDLFQDTRAGITNRTLIIHNHGKTVPAAQTQMSTSTYSSYSYALDGGRTWLLPAEDLNQFESIKILGHAHLALYSEEIRYCSTSIYYSSDRCVFII